MLALASAALALTPPPVRRPAPALLRDRQPTWSNPQGATLTQIREDVWLAERPFYPTLPGLQGTDVGCKMCVVRLPDGTLWVHAPVALDDALRRALAELGEVRHIVTPNTEHQKWAAPWILEFPDAASYAPPGLREKKPEVGWKRSLEELCDLGVTSSAPPAEWGGAIQLCWLKDRVPLTSVPFFNEVVFAHVPSRTLIVTDLWWNYPSSDDVPTSSKIWKAAMDNIYRPVYNRLMRGPNWDESYDTIMGFDFDYIAPCHGEPVATDGKAVLARHLAKIAS
ncbi:hypothetical protein AB1Y20_020549 [Prymnesium parvum]|uniref:DUF4336 domain-containing protein n=1 Tax=Prymnesium parvum TaxID=97485 RepID=A0AB34JXI4_PRYPA